MIVGFCEHNRAHTVIGIDGSCTADVLRTQMKRIVKNTSNWSSSREKIEDREIVINPDYAYPAYGVPSDETNEAIRLAARQTMITDPVYEAEIYARTDRFGAKGIF